MGNIYISSPIGKMRIELRGDTVLGAWFLEDEDCNNISTNSDTMNLVTKQFSEYFSGQRYEFSIDFDLGDATQFQKDVWAEMLKIPCGQTRSYAEIAENIGKPKAARAVGMACNRNPIAILVPCHRIIGSGGKLTGYAGGLQKKQWLLEHEKCIGKC